MLGIGRVIGETRAALGEDGRRIRWVQLEGLHLTLRFLGPTMADRVPDVAAALDRAAAGEAPFEVRLAGAGAGMMELRFLAANAEVQIGDILVTSGLDGVYLPGLPVAKVVKTDRDSAYSFARITCAPLAGVERHGLALVLGSRTALPPQPEEAPATVETPGRGKRIKKKEKAP